MGAHVRVLLNNSLLPLSALSTNTPYLTVTFFILLGLLFALESLCGAFMFYYVCTCFLPRVEGCLLYDRSCEVPVITQHLFDTWWIDCGCLRGESIYMAQCVCAVHASPGSRTLFYLGSMPRRGNGLCTYQ
jgi:hypothetical protein